MNKKISFILIFINIIALISLAFFNLNKDTVNKISIFLSALLSLLLSLLLGNKKQKNGLIWGLVIGISIASISSIIHFIYAKDLFNLLHIRMGIIILSGGCGGIIGVNKKTLEN